MLYFLKCTRPYFVLCTGVVEVSNPELIFHSFRASNHLMGVSKLYDILG